MKRRREWCWTVQLVDLNEVQSCVVCVWKDLSREEKMIGKVNINIISRTIWSACLVECRGDSLLWIDDRYGLSEMHCVCCYLSPSLFALPDWVQNGSVSRRWVNGVYRALGVIECRSVCADEREAGEVLKGLSWEYASDSFVSYIGWKKWDKWKKQFVQKGFVCLCK